MVIEPWGLDVVIRGAIAAVGNIRDEIIVFAVIAPAPPSAIWGENDWVKPIPSHSTQPAVAWVVRVLVILVVQLEPAVQFTLADETVDPLLARFTSPIGVDHRPILSPLRAAEPVLFDYRAVFGVL